MANSALSTPTASLADVGRLGEIRSRVLFLVGALVVYRIGTYIPVPGINPTAVSRFFGGQGGNTILGIFNTFNGGALQRLSIFAMGVMPYISASIIIQMLAMVIPSLMEARKEGEAGRRYITQLTRYWTVALAVFQSFGAAVALQSGGMTLVTGWQWLFNATITMTTGTVFLMWLGEQITERGVGNGISMLILAGIVAQMPAALGRTIDSVSTGQLNPLFTILLIGIVIGVTAFCCFMERAQRKITVNYAKRQVGRRMYAGQSSHLPFKINMSGVIPPIFASSLLLFPATVASFFGTNPNSRLAGVLQDISTSLGYGQPLHIVLYGFLCIFFCFFYTALVFNSRETADNLKKSGAFIPGIRPGQQTGEYIDKVLTRLTLWGAFYVTAVCLVPEFLVSSQGVPFQFGGTSLLIVVVVVMDFMAQMQAHLMSHHYPGLMKKANLLGGRGGASQ
ncbi:MAG TPA: preprotein translocase subunit SecY [Steroidobacteraceae bacterium]|nr:preprotein translocase subunit SecY [Steroidobacteraceae bacterium]